MCWTGMYGFLICSIASYREHFGSPSRFSASWAANWMDLLSLSCFFANSVNSSDSESFFSSYS